MKVILDRFENDKAILELEEGEFVSAPKILFNNAKEGDVISIEVDKSRTDERKENIEKLMKDLWEKT